MIIKKQAIEILNSTQQIADELSGCNKVSVGSKLIGKGYTVYGANTVVGDLCKTEGCLRKKLYGEDSKNHRLPSDCRSIHSEVDVIAQAARYGYKTAGATLFVTRYPCEACARAIIKAGISTVIYGREQEISEQTKEMFKAAGVSIIHISEWDYLDTTR